MTELPNYDIGKHQVHDEEVSCPVTNASMTFMAAEVTCPVTIAAT